MDNNNNYNRDNNKQTNETRDESKEDDDEDRYSVNSQPTNNNTATTKNLPTKTDDESYVTMRKEEEEEEAEKQEDTEDDEDGSLHTVPSVKEIKPSPTTPPTQVVTLEGTHTTATATESFESMATKIARHVSFEQIIEDLELPVPSTSKVVENVREYVKQIESRLEDNEGAPSRSTTSTQLSAAQIIEQPKEAMRLETIKGASELSFTSQQSDESLAILSEVETIAHDEVERIVAENVAASATQRVSERADFQQVERENQEIAERFKQIMEMFDSFTKNLESLEMPAIKPAEEVKEKSTTMPLRRRLSFKGLRGAECAGSASGAAMMSSPGGSGSIYNEFYLEVHGDHRNESDTTSSVKEPAASKNRTPQSTCSTSSCSAYPQKAEAAIDPMVRDIATTVSGLELLDEPPLPAPPILSKQPQPSVRAATHKLSTIGCQTTGDYFSMPMMSTSASTSFSNLHTTAPKDYSQTDDDDVVNALIIDSITDATTSSCAGAVTTSFTDITETSNITVVQPSTKILGTTDQSALVKIREPPTIIDLTQDSMAPRVTSIVNDSAGLTGTTTTTTTDAPCERTYHTIHIEANSSPSSSEMRRPPLWSRLWNVITDFCAAVCLCLQVNKDCLFCFGFFIAFVVSASFLTAFFYRTLSINPQLLQVPAVPSNIANHVNALHNIRSENSAYDV